MKTMTELRNLLTADRAAYRAFAQSVRANLAKIEAIYSEDAAAGKTPKETVIRMIKEVGKEETRDILATLIMGSAWDGRISETAKEWAVNSGNGYDEEAAEALWIRSNIHRTHLNQLAEAAGSIRPSDLEEPAPETVEETEPARTREEVVTDILTYFEENEDTFTACLEELDSYNGYLGDDRYYDMEELAEFYHDADPLELLNRAYYGYAEDSCTVDQWGTKRHDPFNPNADYFRYNGYGNLVSSNYKDYSDHLDHYAVDAMQENRAELPTIDDTPELSDLFDELDRVSEAL